MNSLNINFLQPSNCNVNISNNVSIGRNIVVSGKCKSLSIGFGSFLGRDIYIDAEFLEIGEYTTIHHGSIIQGKHVSIGHNCWFGHYTVIDGTGGCYIGNNVGVGSHSQLWSHMKFGDRLEGCRFSSEGRLVLEDDVWLVGRSTIGPITAKSKSMLLANSYATNDMESNSLYSGFPAQKLENSKGQFKEKDTKKKCVELRKLIDDYIEQNNVENLKYRILTEGDFSIDDHKSGIIQFNVGSRTYCPTRSQSEYSLIKYMLYDKAKFLPSFPRFLHDPL